MGHPCEHPCRRFHSSRSGFSHRINTVGGSSVAAAIILREGDMDDQAVPVVSYARISADTARDEHGVVDQHKVNLETAKRLGWAVVHEITDNDRSASKLGVVR